MAEPDNRDIALAQTDVPPSPAGKLATLEDRLQMNKLTLIGTAGRDGHRVALLRQPGGAILTVTNGDTTPKGKVAAIGQSEIHLARKNGKLVKLVLSDCQPETATS